MMRSRRNAGLPYRLGTLATGIGVVAIGYYCFRGYVDSWVPRLVATSLLYSSLGGLAFVAVIIGPVPRAWKFGLFFVTWVTARFILNVVSDGVTFAAIVGLAQYVVPFIAAAAGILVLERRGEKVLGWVLACFAGAALLVALLGSPGMAAPGDSWGTELVLVNGTRVRRLVSPIGNSLATGYTSAVLLVLLIASGPRRAMLAPVAVWGVLQSFSRGALLFAAVGVSVVVAAWLLRFRLSLDRVLIVCLVVLTGTLLAGGIATSGMLEAEGVQLVAGRFAGDLFNMAESGNARRVASWLETISLWQEDPVVGVGLGELGASAVSQEVRAFAPESMYLKVLGELGLVGLFLYLVPIGVGMREIFRQGWYASRVRVASGAIALAFCVASIYLQVLEYDFFALLFWLAIVFGGARSPRPGVHRGVPVSAGGS